MLDLYLYSTFLSFFAFFCILYLFKRVGIVDKPDGVRKIHKGEIPLGGGIALFISCSLILLLFFPAYLFGNTDLVYVLRNIWLISLIILFMGLWDDVKPLPYSVRLIIQILASWLVIVFTDVYIKDLGNLLGLGNIYIGKLGIPVTIFMVVGVCNAFNMLDGMDGLVGFVMLVMTFSISLIAVFGGMNSMIFLASSTFAVFLMFNLGFLGQKNKIFLGDSGAMWLGFISAWVLVFITQDGEGYLFQPVTALWLILLPLIDALSTFLSRLKNKRSMFSADRTHIHHILLDSGLKKWKVILIFLLASIFSNIFALYFTLEGTDEYYQFYGFLMIWFFYFLILKFPTPKK